MHTRNIVVILLGFAILASLIHGLYFVGIYLPRLPLTIPLCLSTGAFVTWKGKYAPSISVAELLLAVCMAAFSAVLNMGLPPGGRVVWAWLLVISAIVFGSLGTPVFVLFSRNKTAWKNTNF